MRDTADHTIRRIVRTLIEQYDWALLQEEDLVELVLGSIQSEVSPAEVRKRTVHHYTAVLYEACRQDNDPDRRERGYHELHRYLYRAAYNKWPELAEDATQQALLLVYEQIDRCRNPGTFLAFALFKLRHAFKLVQPPDDVPPLPEVDQSSFDQGRVSPSSHLEQQECYQALLDAIERLPNDRQRKVITLKYFAGWSDAEIGAQIGITPGYVRVLRHRAKNRLRENERLRGCFEEGDSEERLYLFNKSGQSTSSAG